MLVHFFLIDFKQPNNKKRSLDFTQSKNKKVYTINRALKYKEPKVGALIF